MLVHTEHCAHAAAAGNVGTAAAGVVLALLL
jgi:hypothetical protein